MKKIAISFLLLTAIISCQKEVSKNDKVKIAPTEEVLSLLDNDTTKPGDKMWYPTPTCQCWEYRYDATFNKYRWMVVGFQECEGLPNDCRGGVARKSPGAPSISN